MSLVHRYLNVKLAPEQWEAVDRLVSTVNLERKLEGLPCVNDSELAQILLEHVAEGIQRPASWEAEWVAEVLGEVATAQAQAEAGSEE